MPEMSYAKLFGRMKELDLTQKAVAEAIGVSESHFCCKLSGKYVFKQSEIQNICLLLHIQASEIGNYFFTPKVEKT